MVAYGDISETDRKAVTTWLKRHKGPKRVEAGTRGIVRMAKRRRALAPVCRLGGAWFVVRTRVKAEDEATAALRDAGLEVYLPEFRVETYNRKRRVTMVAVHRMFPRYLFVRAHLDQVGLIRGCEGVEDVLPGFPHEPVALSGREGEAIETMRRQQAELMFDDTAEARRRRGQTAKGALRAIRNRMRNRAVRITEGPFLGYHGTVEAVESVERVRVLIKVMGRQTVVGLEAGQVELEAA